nr:HAD family hydrolase [uncultured Kingella sp.]
MNAHSQTLLLAVREKWVSQQPEIDEKYIAATLKQAENADVVSFDIFDTVLTRVLECPIDVFAYVERELLAQGLPAKGFAKIRFDAENRARAVAWNATKAEEITFNEIYQQVQNAPQLAGASNVVEAAREAEIQAEQIACVPIADQVELIKRLKAAGKTIIFVSDMYLSQAQIQAILAYNQIDSLCEHLFVSSEYNKTKHTGKIWDMVRQHIPATQRILHIGDNVHSDVEQPQKADIDTLHYPRFIAERRVGASLSAELVPFSILSRLADLAAQKEHDPEEAFWRKLGQSLGALTLYSYIQWLAEQVKCNKIEHIYFCARDAQVIQAAWNICDLDQACGTTSSYLYVSRKVLRYSTCYTEIVQNGRLSDESLLFLVEHSLNENSTFRDIFKPFNLSDAIINQHGLCDIIESLDSVIDWSKTAAIKEYINSYLLDDMLPAFKAVFDNAMGYYHQEGVFFADRKVAIMDLGWAGTMQAALIDLRRYMGVEKNLAGYYYGLWGVDNAVAGKAYHNGIMLSAFSNKFEQYKDALLLRNGVNLLENLHSANHETTVDFKQVGDAFEPMFKKDVHYRYLSWFNSTIAHFQAAALDAIRTWHAGEKHLTLSADEVSIDTAIAAMMQVFCSPNKQEIAHLGQIMHAATYAHAEFRPIVENELPKNESEVYSFLYGGGWPCGVMKYWCNSGLQATNSHLYNVAKNEFAAYPEFIRNQF